MAGCRLAALAPGLQLRRQHLCPYVVRAEDPRLHRRLSIVLKEGREELELDAVVSHGYSALIELLWHWERAGYRIEEVPITFVDRELGRSKVSR